MSTNFVLHKMGGCKEGTDSCTSKACKGFEVDIMHFSIGNAIPGRLYGGNPVDNGEGNGGDRWFDLMLYQFSDSSSVPYLFCKLLIVPLFIFSYWMSLCFSIWTDLVIWLTFMLGIHIVDTLMVLVPQVLLVSDKRVLYFNSQGN